VNRAPPASSSGRRPCLSVHRPAKGRSTRAVTLNAPTTTPTPIGPAPSGPAANNGTTGIITPNAVKYANSASVNATNAGVNNAAPSLRLERDRSASPSTTVPGHVTPHLRFR